MRPVRRAVPSPAALLTAVLLALSAVLGVGGPPPATTGGPTAVGPATHPGEKPTQAADQATHAAEQATHTAEKATQAGEAARRATEKWDTTVAPARSAHRHEPHGDPAPRGHLAPCAPATAPALPRAWRLPAATGETPCPAPRTPPDRGRAPPAASGT
ncbi:hypothetical protein [Streptomyces griseosporeus]|uniref:hypothetical protein n=1 Tax=Streptomyces griseosporeus TaxID=1910 RepID=UPI0036F6746E